MALESFVSLRGEKSQRLICLALLAGGILLRLYGLGEPQLWLDELIQISRSTQPGVRAILQDVSTETAAVPLDYLVQGTFVRLLGTSAWAARLHAALLGCLSLALIYWLGVRLLGPLQELAAGMGGLLSLFMLALYPLHIFYSQEGRNYSLFFFCTLLSYGLLVEAMRRRSPLWWALYAAGLTSMLYANYLGILALAAQGVFVLAWLKLTGSPDLRVWGGGAAPRVLMGFLLSATASFALLLPWLLQTYSRARDTFREEFLSVRFVLSFIQESSGGSLPLSLLLLGLAAMGLWRLWRMQAYGIAALLLSWAVIPVAAVFFLDWWRGYFFAARQILFASPPLLLAGALGLAALLHAPQSKMRRRLPAALIALTALLGLGTVSLSKGKQSADWEALDRYLHTQVKQQDWVAAPHIERPVGWRYRDLYRRRALLEELPPRGEWPWKAEPSSLHLIESRYTTAEQRQMIVRTVAAAERSRTVEVGGFRVYVLKAE